MKKKLTISLIGFLAVVVLPLGAAFEAHTINVTADIQNALAVSPSNLDFGIVFPQEEFNYPFIEIALSDSFVNEGKVNEVSYEIRQKPKVKECDANPDADPWKEITVGDFIGFAHKYCLENLPENSPIEYNPDDEYYNYCYVPLANYLSKHKDSAEVDEDNDTEIDAPHYAYQWDVNGKSSLNPDSIAVGYLSKAAGDTEDKWIIDLKVPCFQGMCDQNPSMESEWWLDTDAEGKEFGTDLWIEVTEISRNHLWIEAEDYDQIEEPMQKGNDANASGGQFISIPEGQGTYPNVNGYTEYSFDVSEEDDYVIWGRVIAPGTSSDSFFISMNGNPDGIWDTAPIGTAWVWDQINARDANTGNIIDPAIFHLTKGHHTLTIKEREDGTKLDQILITNDMSYTP